MRPEDDECVEYPYTLKRRGISDIYGLSGCCWWIRKCCDDFVWRDWCSTLRGYQRDGQFVWRSGVLESSALAGWPLISSWNSVLLLLQQQSVFVRSGPCNCCSSLANCASLVYIVSLAQLQAALCCLLTCIGCSVKEVFRSLFTVFLTPQGFARSMQIANLCVLCCALLYFDTSLSLIPPLFSHLPFMAEL